MISSSWGAPAAFTKGFNLQHVSDGLYGRHLHVYSWPGGELRQTLDLGESGLLPLEVHCLKSGVISTSYNAFYGIFWFFFFVFAVIEAIMLMYL